MLGDDGDLQLLLEDMEVISCVVKTRPPVLSRAVKIIQPMDFTIRRWANEKKCDMRWSLDQVVATFTYEVANILIAEENLTKVYHFSN